MGKDTIVILFVALCSAILAIALVHPVFLSDRGNAFLKDFMDNDILSVLGFITAVGNAATLSIFLHLNQLEDQTEAKFSRTRVSLKKSALSLVVVFLICFVIVVVKPILPLSDYYSALCNGIGVVCVFFSLSVLRDLTLTVFGIPTKKAISEIAENNRRKNGRKP